MKLFPKLVIAILAIELMWFLLPQVEWRWLSEDSLVILSYSGFGSYHGMETWMSWIFLAVTVFVTVGLLFFGRKWAFLYLLLIAAGTLVVVPLSGINVETGPSMALRDVLSMMIGSLVTLIYLRNRSDTSEPTLDNND